MPCTVASIEQPRCSAYGLPRSVGPLFYDFCNKIRLKVQIQEPLPVLRCLPNGIIHMHFSTMY